MIENNVYILFSKNLILIVCNKPTLRIILTSHFNKCVCWENNLFKKLFWRKTTKNLIFFKKNLTKSTHENVSHQKYQYLKEFHAQIHSWKIIINSTYWHTKVKKKKSIHFFFKTINSNFLFCYYHFNFQFRQSKKEYMNFEPYLWHNYNFCRFFTRGQGFSRFFVHSLKPKHWIHAVELEISSYSDQVVEYVLVFALSWAKKWHLTGTLRDNRVTCASTCMK